MYKNNIHIKIITYIRTDQTFNKLEQKQAPVKHTQQMYSIQIYLEKTQNAVSME